MVTEELPFCVLYKFESTVHAKNQQRLKNQPVDFIRNVSSIATSKPV